MERFKPLSGQQSVRAIFALTLFAISAATALAQPTPRTTTIIVPQAAGGSSDILGRAVAERLANRWKTAVVVENRPGANGNIGTEQVARGKSDGTVLLLQYSATLTANPYLYQRVPFDAIKDFRLVAPVAEVPLVLVVNPQLAAQTTDQFIALAKTKGLTYGSAGNGTVNHLAGEYAFSEAGITVTHVPYRGVAASLADLMGGQIDSAFSSMAPAIPLIRSGKLRALAVTSSKRVKALGDVPTFMESKAARVSSTSWYAVLAPATVPADQLEFLRREVTAAIEGPEFEARLETLGAERMRVAYADWEKLITEESKVWAAVIKRAGAKLD